MLVFHRDGLDFQFRDEGCGLPFVFQHGLGGDQSQSRGVYQPGPGVRLIGFDFRGHGETRPLGDAAKLKIAALADDLVALLDHLKIERAVVGGISLGSAVAVNTALRYPERVLGLVLSRPAWIDRPLPDNVRHFSLIAGLLHSVGAKEGLERFRRTAEFQAMKADRRIVPIRLVGQFEQSRAVDVPPGCSNLIVDTPCPDRSMYATINVPTLVLGNHQDPIHPGPGRDTGRADSGCRVV